MSLQTLKIPVAPATRLPSRPGEFHPEPLKEPDLTLSRHPARAIARRLPPSIEHRVPPVAGWPEPNGDDLLHWDRNRARPAV